MVAARVERLKDTRIDVMAVLVRLQKSFGEECNQEELVSSLVLRVSAGSDSIHSTDLVTVRPLSGRERKLQSSKAKKQEKKNTRTSRRQAE